MKVRKNTTTAKATRIFTDREEPRAVFWKQYNVTKTELHQDDCNIRVLNYYGIGGIGKSSLLKKLISEMDEQLSEPRYIYIDLNICQESRAVLERMKNKLVDNYKFDFPLFELGSYAYAKKVGENADPIEVKQLTEKSPLLSMMLSAAGEIPIVGIAAKVLSFADQGIAYIRTHLKNHNRELKQIEIMEADDLYKYLPYLFSQDLAHNLEKEAEEPLVILLDTYEKLVNEIGSVGDPHKNDEWIRGEKGLVQNIPNVLWVIAGREKLKWATFDSEWADALDTHILGNLSNEDSDYFLLNSGITDANLREQLYTLTNGTPVYLDLCVDRFFRILDNGKIPDITMFGKNTYDLIERFVRYMDDTQKDLVYMLACLINWDDAFITDIAPKILPNFSFVAYDKVKEYSFVILSDDGCYHLHQTICDILKNNCPHIIKQRVGKALIEKYAYFFDKEKVLTNETVELYNIVQAGLLLYEDRVDFLAFYQKKIKIYLLGFASAGCHEKVKIVYDMLHGFVSENKNDLLYATVLMDNANCKELEGKFGVAKELAETALKVFINVCGEDDEKALKAMGVLATIYAHTEKLLDAQTMALDMFEKSSNKLGYDHWVTIKAACVLGEVLYIRGKYEKAKVWCQFVLKKTQIVFGEDSISTLNAMNSLANVYAAMSEFEEAQDLYETSLEKHKCVMGINHPGTCVIMCNLASLYFAQKKHKEATTQLRIALDRITSVLGENHPQSLKIKQQLAVCLQKQGEYQQALIMFEEIFEVQKKIYNTHYNGIIDSLNDIVCVLYDMSEYQKIVDLYKNEFDECLEKLGENHTYTYAVQYNYGHSLKYLDSEAKAVDVLEDLLSKERTTYGESFPDTIKTKKILIELYSKLNETEKANALRKEVTEKSE